MVSVALECASLGCPCLDAVRAQSRAGPQRAGMAALPNPVHQVPIPGWAVVGFPASLDAGCFRNYMRNAFPGDVQEEVELICKATPVLSRSGHPSGKAFRAQGPG